MKKGTKFLLLGGLLLSLIGILIIFASAAVAGPAALSKMLENGDFTVKIDGTDIMLLGEPEGDWVTFANEETGELAKAEDIKKIDASIGGGVFKIKESEEYENFTVKYEGSSKNCTWKLKGDTLLIDNTLVFNRKNKWNNNVGEIVLYVPKGASLESLEIELGGGEMKLDNIKAEKADISIGAGELSMNSFASSSLNIDMGAGEVKIKNAKIDSLNMDMAMGNAEYQGEIARKAVINCSMGEIDLELSGRKKDFNYSIDCSAGNVEIEDSEYSGLGVTTELDYEAEKEIVVDCSMGNVEIKFDE